MGKRKINRMKYLIKTIITIIIMILPTTIIIKIIEILAKHNDITGNHPIMKTAEIICMSIVIISIVSAIIYQINITVKRCRDFERNSTLVCIYSAMLIICPPMWIIYSVIPGEKQSNPTFIKGKSHSKTPK